MANPTTMPTLRDCARLLASGETTARELCDRAIGVIDATNGKINACIHLDADAARRDADQSDERRRGGGALGILDGVPVGMKDNLAVNGQPCTCASRILDGFTSPYDATVAARLKASGAIPFGRFNMDEFAMGSSNEHSVYGRVANPRSPEHVPGGSSGGSAAAVAAGMVPAALGSDTGGSIRQPASFCGVVGMKPTYGRVSRYGLVAFASSLDQIGPVTNTVEDAALLLNVISGHDPADSTTLDVDVPDFTAGLADADVNGLRVGVPSEHLEAAGLSPEVGERVRGAADLLEKNGAELVEVHLPHTKYAVAAYYIIATAEASANLARFDGIRYGRRTDSEHATDLLKTYRLSRAEGFGDEVKRRIILGTYVLSSGYYDAFYLRAQKTRTLIRQDFEAAFGTCDVILGATSPGTAFRAGTVSDPLDIYLADVFTVPANLAGLCGISVPFGTSASEENLPIGVQFMAPALEESRLLKAATAFERLTGTGQ